MEKNKFPSDAQLKKMRKKLSHVKGTYLLPPEASPIDRAKYDICTQILKVQMKKGFSQRALAKELGVAETRVSEILHRRIQSFTLDRLFGYLLTIKPNTKLKVA